MLDYIIQLWRHNFRDSEVSSRMIRYFETFNSDKKERFVQAWYFGGLDIPELYSVDLQFGEELRDSQNLLITSGQLHPFSNILKFRFIGKIFFQ